MGRIAILLGFFFLLGSSSVSYTQPLFQKGPLISVYGGTDNYKFLWKLDYPDTLQPDSIRLHINHLSSSGLWGVKVEQLLTRKFGVTLDFWYGQTNVTGTCFKLVENQPYIDPVSGNTIYPSQPYTMEEVYFSKRLSRLNATLRFDLHFSKSKIVDPYVFAAMGGSLYNLTFSTSNRDIYDEDRFYLPISFKLGGGFRFFPHPRFGIFSEFSLGGPLISLGVSYKFYKRQDTW